MVDSEGSLWGKTLLTPPVSYSRSLRKRNRSANFGTIHGKTTGTELLTTATGIQIAATRTAIGTLLTAMSSAPDSQSSARTRFQLKSRISTSCKLPISRAASSHSMVQTGLTRFSKSALSSATTLARAWRQLLMLVMLRCPELNTNICSSRASRVASANTSRQMTSRCPTTQRRLILMESTFLSSTSSLRTTIPAMLMSIRGSLTWWLELLIQTPLSQTSTTRASRELTTTKRWIFFWSLNSKKVSQISEMAISAYNHEESTSF